MHNKGQILESKYVDYVHKDKTGRKSAVEFKKGLRAVRDLRSSLTLLAELIGSKDFDYAILALSEPKISQHRIVEEWEAFSGILKTDLARRIAIVTQRGEKTKVISRSTEVLRGIAEDVIQHTREAPHPTAQDKRPSSAFSIAKILLVRWLSGAGPVTKRDLAEISGYSLPTVDTALHPLAAYMDDSISRGVQLRTFPTQAWDRLLAFAPQARKTIWLQDVGDRPRSVQYFREQIAHLKSDRIAFGGVLAARHWDPDFDLIGSPRLDLCYHAPDGVMDVDTIRSIYPGLQEVDDNRNTPVIVIHGVFQAKMDTLWLEDERLWVSDVVECLLDLHEMRLINQAHDLIETMKKRNQNGNA